MLTLYQQEHSPTLMATALTYHSVREELFLEVDKLYTTLRQNVTFWQEAEARVKEAVINDRLEYMRMYMTPLRSAPFMGVGLRAAVRLSVVQPAMPPVDMQPAYAYEQVYYQEYDVRLTSQWIQPGRLARYSTPFACDVGALPLPDESVAQRGMSRPLGMPSSDAAASPCEQDRTLFISTGTLHPGTSRAFNRAVSALLNTLRAVVQCPERTTVILVGRDQMELLVVPFLEGLQGLRGIVLRTDNHEDSPRAMARTMLRYLEQLTENEKGTAHPHLAMMVPADAVFQRDPFTFAAQEPEVLHLCGTERNAHARRRWLWGCGAHPWQLHWQVQSTFAVGSAARLRRHLRRMLFHSTPGPSCTLQDRLQRLYTSKQLADDGPLWVGAADASAYETLAASERKLQLRRSPGGTGCVLVNSVGVPAAILDHQLRFDYVGRGFGAQNLQLAERGWGARARSTSLQKRTWLTQSRGRLRRR
jgi:hypothetical protein